MSQAQAAAVLLWLLASLACCQAQNPDPEEGDLTKLRAEMHALLAGVEALQQAVQDGSLTGEILASETGSLADRWEDLRDGARLGADPLGQWLFDAWVIEDTLRELPRTLEDFGAGFVGSSLGVAEASAGHWIRRLEAVPDLSAAFEALQSLESLLHLTSARIKADACSEGELGAACSRAQALLQTALAGMPEILGTPFATWLQHFGAVGLRELNVNAQIFSSIENMSFFLADDLAGTADALRGLLRVVGEE